MRQPDTYTAPLLPGEYYHIYNRGNNYQDVFTAPENYTAFLKKWRNTFFRLQRHLRISSYQTTFMLWCK